MEEVGQWPMPAENKKREGKLVSLTPELPMSSKSVLRAVDPQTKHASPASILR
jgi:hypothetical protein